MINSINRGVAKFAEPFSVVLCVLYGDSNLLTTEVTEFAEISQRHSLWLSVCSVVKKLISIHHSLNSIRHF